MNSWISTRIGLARSSTGAGKFASVPTFEFWLRVGEVALQSFYRVGGLLENRRSRGAFTQSRDLVGEDVLIARDSLGELRRLLRHEPAKSEDHGEGRGDDDRHTDHPRNLQSAQEKKRRREHEAQQDGESDRDKHLARDIEPGDDDGRDQQALKRRGPRFRARGEDREAWWHESPPCAPYARGAAVASSQSGVVGS